MTEPEVMVEEEEEMVDMEEEAAQLARNWEVGSRGRVAGSGMEPGIRPNKGKGKPGGGGCCCCLAADRATEAAAACR